MSSLKPQARDLEPTRVRLIVAAWLCGLSAILYLDRVCMAQALEPIRAELRLSYTQISYVAMAFTLAYGLCAVPAGRWGDRSGPRAVLTRIVLAWSAFTALTGLATGLLTLIGVRLLFGAAEAGAFPNAAKIMSRWFPAGERGRVQGVMLAFAHLGAVIAPAGAASLIDNAGWRWTFFAFGLLGVAWAIGFWFWFRDNPADHPAVNGAEAAVIRATETPQVLQEPVQSCAAENGVEVQALNVSWTPPDIASNGGQCPPYRAGFNPVGSAPRTAISTIESPGNRAAGVPTGGSAVVNTAGEGTGGTCVDPGPVPWPAVAVNRGIIVLSLIMIVGAFHSYFFYTWFPTYLCDARGVPNQKAGWLASLVIGGSAVGMLAGGWLADRIPRWTAHPVAARRYLGVVSYLTAAMCLFLGIRCDDAVSLACLWGASFCAMHLTLPNWWSVAIAQSGKHVGTLFGLMNGIGVIGAMASQGFVGIFADWQKNRGLSGRAQWDPLFGVYVGVLLCGAAGWWVYRFTPLADGLAPQVANDHDR